MKHVYIFDMDNEFVKIGIAENVQKRMSVVSHSSGFAVLQYHQTEIMPNDKARELEKVLHTYFAAYRTCGEYFKISFAEACAELDERKPAGSFACVPDKKVDLKKRIRTPQKRISDTISLFFKKFCTTDENNRGVCGGGITRESFHDNFVKWFNANSKDFICKRNGYWGVEFYSRATGEEITSGFVTSTIWSKALEHIEYHLGKFAPDHYSDEWDWLYFRVYWRPYTPPELALQQRVKRVRDAFTGLDQQEKDLIIGGFVNDFLKDKQSFALIKSEYFGEYFDFGDFAGYSLERYIEHRLHELCGEYFRVHIDDDERDVPPCSRYRGITVHPCAYELDDAKIGVYHSDFLQLIQRCCSLECFFDGGWLRLRHTGEGGGAAHD